MGKVRTIPVRIDMVGTFNQMIDVVNKMEDVPRELEVIDVKFKIICQHIEKIAKRALALGDPEQLESLKALGVIQEAKGEEKHV